MALVTDVVRVHVPVWPDLDRDQERAAYFGELCLGDIRRCLYARYDHRTTDEREEFLSQDLRCAVGLARIAGRYAVRVLDRDLEVRR